MAAADDVAPDDVRALLAVPLEEFVAARTARVKELRAEGRRDEAAALAKLRKPARLVWIVGELARRHPDLAATAAAVAEDLEAAQAGGGAVRPLLTQFRDVVGQVAERAAGIEGVVDRLQVGLALREVLADRDARDAWTDGRLLDLPGVDGEDAPTDELAARRAQKAAATTVARGRAAPAGDGEAAAEARATAERRAAEEAEAERRAAEEVVAATEAAVAEASSARDAATAALAELEEQRARLEARVDQARQAVDQAEGDLAAAGERHATARAALDDLGGPRSSGRRRR